MIVDTSAVCAIVLDEPGAERLLTAVVKAEKKLMSAASYLEASIVIDSRRDPVASNQLDTILNGLGISIEAVSAEQAAIARAAYRNFGKNSGHPARLNFGDCFVYALTKDKSDELLFVGDDFGKTDLIAADY